MPRKLDIQEWSDPAGDRARKKKEREESKKREEADKKRKIEEAREAAEAKKVAAVKEKVAKRLEADTALREAHEAYEFSYLNLLSTIEAELHYTPRPTGDASRALETHFKKNDTAAGLFKQRKEELKRALVYLDKQIHASNVEDPEELGEIIRIRAGNVEDLHGLLEEAMGELLVAKKEERWDKHEEFKSDTLKKFETSLRAIVTPKPKRRRILKKPGESS